MNVTKSMYAQALASFMRSALLFILLYSCLGARAQTAVLAPVQQHLDVLARKYDVNIAYTAKLLPVAPVSFEAADLSIEQDLTRLLRPLNLDFETVGDQYVVIPYTAKSLTITGFIEDARTRERLVGATLYALRAQRGVTTNGYGYFSLTDLQPEDRLVVRYIGYTSDTVAVRKLRQLPSLIQLSPHIELLTVEILGKVASRTPLPTEGRALSPTILAKTELINGRADLNSWLSLQPGIQSTAGGYRGYSFRGADPEHNLMLLDDATLYLPSHAVGYFSVVPGEAVRSWSLHRDAGSARYGDRIGGVVDLRLREGSKLKQGGSINVGLSDIGITVDGPVGKGSYFASGRRGLTDFWLRALRPSERQANQNQPDLDFGFYDLALKINQPLGKQQQLLGSVFIARDRYADAASVFRANSLTNLSYQDRSQRTWSNLLGSLRHNIILGNRWFANSTLTLSDFSYVAEDALQLTVQDSRHPDSIVISTSNNVFDSQIRDLGLKTDLQYALSRQSVLHFGLDAVAHRFKIQNEAQLITTRNDVGGNPDIPVFGTPTLPSITTYDLSTYAELNFRPSPELKVDLGVRWSSQLSSSSTKAFNAILPRLSAKYALTPKLELSATAARARQYIHQIGTNNPGLPRDLWVPSIRGIRPMESDQLGISATYAPWLGTNLSLGTYYTKLRGLTRFTNDYVGSDYEDWLGNVRTGQGEAVGVELQSAVNVGNFEILSAYTLAKSTRQFSDGFGGLDLPERARLDRRHAFSTLVEYRASRKWTMSSTFRAGSGLPARLPQRGDVNVTLPETNLPLTNSWNYDGKQIQLKPYYSLDAGLRYEIARDGKLQKLSLGVQNLTFRKNPLFINLRTIRDPQPGQGLYELTEVYAPPFIPFFRLSSSF